VATKHPAAPILLARGDDRRMACFRCEIEALGLDGRIVVLSACQPPREV
jgi:hypothetical protein